MPISHTIHGCSPFPIDDIETRSSSQPEGDANEQDAHRVQTGNTPGEHVIDTPAGNHPPQSDCKEAIKSKTVLSKGINSEILPTASWPCANEPRQSGSPTSRRR